MATHTLDRLTQLMKELSDIDSLLKKFLDERHSLPKTDETLRMTDMDDTLFARDEQLEKESGLRENRGELGNKYIMYHMGLPYFIENYYEGKSIPQEIISQLDVATDCIITAGFEAIQKEKVRALGLSKYHLIITKNGEEKILATIRYVLYTLCYIPKEIIIYEDRPHYFVQYRELIEGVLDCKLTVMQVEMNGNDGYKKIEEI